jgi:uncharacterized membrane protein
MKPDHFLDRLQHHQIVEAIHQAERNTTGRIQVFVSHAAAPDPLEAARERFHKMQMHRHAHRNAILIFVAPRSQTFAVLGDELIHTRIGDQAWQSLVGSMAEQFKSDQYMKAILFGIEQAGQLLANHFPKPVGPAAHS